MKKKLNKYFRYFTQGLKNKEISEKFSVDKSTVSKARVLYKKYMNDIETETEQKVTELLIKQMSYYDSLSEEDFNNLEEFDIQKKFVYLKLKQYSSLTKLKINLSESLNILIGTSDFRTLIVKEQMLKDKGLELKLAEKEELRRLKLEQTLVSQVITNEEVLLELFKNLNLQIGDV